MTQKDPKLLAERIIAAAKEHSGKRGGVRSPLYDLLWDQHAILAPHLNPPRTPNWEQVARTVAADGVLDGKGQAPKAATVQKTWAKVVRDKVRIAGGPPPLPRVRRRRDKLAAQQEAPTMAAEPKPPTAKPARHPAENDDYDFVKPAGGPRVWKPGERDD